MNKSDKTDLEIHQDKLLDEFYNLKNQQLEALNNGNKEEFDRIDKRMLEIEAEYTNSIEPQKAEIQSKKTAELLQKLFNNQK